MKAFWIILAVECVVAIAGLSLSRAAAKPMPQPPKSNTEK